mgnify:CR=1 FL=1
MPASPARSPLAGVRVVECSMLGPAAITTHLADLGADVIKVESPAGDYIRRMTWPIVEGVSLMHLHINRGKRSVVLDLRTPEGADVFRDLVRDVEYLLALTIPRVDTKPTARKLLDEFGGLGPLLSADAESLRRHDTYGRFRIYHPVTAKGQPIYVHAKLMIVDDQLLRVGSSNINNRSMRFDQECDVALEAAGSQELSARILSFRNDLLAEHLGTTSEMISQTLEEAGSLIAAIDLLRQRNPSSEGGTLTPYVTPEISDLEKWLADHEILDPEGSEAVFEPIEKRGLFRGRLKRPRRKRVG